MKATLKEIAERKGVTWHAIRKRKLKEGWQSCGTRIVNHKVAEEFETDGLAEDIKALFLQPGSMDVTDGENKPPLWSSVASSIDQERVRDRTPDQLAPVQMQPPPCQVPSASVPAHSLSITAENANKNIEIASGELIDTATGEVVNIGTALRPMTDEEIESELYAAAPGWARQKADKYLQIIRASAGLKGASLRQFVAEWNGTQPDLKTSYDAVLDARNKYAEQGIAGLLAKYGHSAGNSKVQDDHYKYFKNAYLKEGAPSVKSCWTRTLGYARTLNPQLQLEGFPSPSAFLRRVEREIPKSSIFLARFGPEAWNRKYASHVDRDYSQIKPGQVIVGDHAQVDVAVMLPNGKACFPWITAWRDYKTSKWLGWLHHPEPPNSDHIFQSFYYTVKENGLPEELYIDNGRDYKSRDFAGGRKRGRVTVDEKKTTSMLSLLGVTPHFALPYNAQTKPIERDFLRNKEWFSKHMPGYRGGNVTERPDSLDGEIKSGRILSYDEYLKLMDVYIMTVANKMPSNGKVLQGRCPDEVWNAERSEMRKVGADALKLFCQRTSKEVTIGRNGVRDSELQVTYFGEFMYALTGTKVYLRRDVQAYQTAWVFDATTDEYLGKANLVGAVQALAKTDIERAELKAALAHKHRTRKIAKSYLKDNRAVAPSETVEHLAAGIVAVNLARGCTTTDKKKVKVLRLAKTAMDEVVRRDREMQLTGTDGYSTLQEISYLEDSRPIRPEKPLIIFESDEADAEAQYQRDMADYLEKKKEYNAAIEKSIVSAGPLLMDLDRERVVAEGKIVDLLPMEFRLLRLLMENRGKVFGRAAIKEAISRNGLSMELRAIDVHVTRLRIKLRKVGAERYVLTKRGSGYFFSEED
ncbi:MAG: winged helix-turn-helix domain-containing protein [Nitrospirota bacterium]|nr:winged helix-turn-helix domain-containing protein [Nitrospirota bacterium]